MRKLGNIIIALTMIVSLITGCSNVGNNIGSGDSIDGGNLDDLDPISITAAHADVGEPTNFMHGALLAFKDYVEEKSNGKISVDVSPGGALGDSDDLMAQVMEGSIEVVGSLSDGSLASAYADYLVYSIPYLFDNEEQALHLYQGAFGKRIWDGFTEKTGAYPLATMSGGFRSTTNNKKQIKTLSDFKGLQIRTMNMPAHMETIKALGAVATPIGWVEVYSALQTGVVDGQENGIASMYMGKLHEVQKYLTLDKHVWTSDVIAMNKKWFDGLPYQYQNIIREGGMVAEKAGQRLCHVLENIGMDYLPTVMDVYTPTKEEMKTFKDATQEPVKEFIRTRVDNQELVDEIIEEAAKALKDLGY